MDTRQLGTKVTLKQLQAWIEQNRITINHNKTVVMHHMYLLSGCASSVGLCVPLCALITSKLPVSWYTTR